MKNCKAQSQNHERLSFMPSIKLNPRWLPDISVIIGIKKEIPDRKFLTLKKVLLFFFYFECLYSKVRNNMAATTSTERTAHIIGGVGMILNRFNLRNETTTLIRCIFTWQYSYGQYINAEYEHEKLHGHKGINLF